MEKNYKIVPFDINKAKAGAEVVTKKDKLKVEILKYDLNDDCQILAIINYNSGLQSVHTYYSNGKRFKNDTNDLDLRIKKEVKYRRMTNQESSNEIVLNHVDEEKRKREEEIERISKKLEEEFERGRDMPTFASRW